MCYGRFRNFPTPDLLNNAAKEYFNLQGVRVETPAAGLYIVRQGDKVYKEMSAQTSLAIRNAAHAFGHPA